MFQFFIFLCLIHASFALICYDCQSASDNDCNQISDEVPDVTCGNVTGFYKTACLTRVLLDQDTHSMNVTRRCIFLPRLHNVLIHECNLKYKARVIHCGVCEKDYCNNFSVASSPSFKNFYYFKFSLLVTMLLLSP